VEVESTFIKERVIMFRKTVIAAAAAVVALNAGTQAAERIVPPDVPTGLEVQGGFKPFMRAHAVGTQNYICAPAATESGVDWLFIGPQATVFGADMEQVLTHYQSNNPDQAGAIQATWQHSRDSSAVWAKRKDGSLDPNYVAPGAIEWLLLEVTGRQAGPTAGDKMVGTVFIQRVNTAGGVKPATGCTAATVNTRKLVPYEADYYFYQ